MLNQVNNTFETIFEHSALCSKKLFALFPIYAYLFKYPSQNQASINTFTNQTQSIL